MDPELQKKMAEALGWIVDGCRGAGEALSREAPEAAREIVAWRFWGGAIYCGAFVLLASAALLIVWRGFRWYRAVMAKKDPHEDGFGPIVAIVLGFLAAGFSLWGAVYQGSQSIKAKVAPRVVVIEAVRGYAR